VRIVPVAVRGVRAVSAVRACPLYAHISVPVLRSPPRLIQALAVRRVQDCRHLPMSLLRGRTGWGAGSGDVVGVVQHDAHHRADPQGRLVAQQCTELLPVRVL
jgi:hypothetical protein